MERFDKEKGPGADIVNLPGKTVVSKPDRGFEKSQPPQSPARTIREIYKKLTQLYVFQPGQLVTAKPGLVTYARCDPGVPVAVVHIYPRQDSDPSKCGGSANGLDMVILVMVDDNTAIRYHVDSQLFEPYLGGGKGRRHD